MKYRGTFEPPFWGVDLSPAPIAGAGTLALDDRGIRLHAFCSEAFQRHALAFLASSLRRSRQRPTSRPFDSFHAWSDVLGMASESRDPTVVVLAVRSGATVHTVHFRPALPAALVLDTLHARAPSDEDVLVARYRVA